MFPGLLQEVAPHYQLDSPEPVGTGVSGAVYFAHDVDNNHQVAIKTVKFDGGTYADLEIQRRDLQRELIALRELSQFDQRIIPLLYAGEVTPPHLNEPFPFLVMPIAHGRSGRKIIAEMRDQDQWRDLELIEMLIEVTSVLEHVHAAGWVYNDVKWDHLFCHCPTPAYHYRLTVIDWANTFWMDDPTRPAEANFASDIRQVGELLSEVSFQNSGFAQKLHQKITETATASTVSSSVEEVVLFLTTERDRYVTQIEKALKAIRRKAEEVVKALISASTSDDASAFRADLKRLLSLDQIPLKYDLCLAQAKEATQAIAKTAGEGLLDLLGRRLRSQPAATSLDETRSWAAILAEIPALTPYAQFRTEPDEALFDYIVLCFEAVSIKGHPFTAPTNITCNIISKSWSLCHELHTKQSPELTPFDIHTSLNKQRTLAPADQQPLLDRIVQAFAQVYLTHEGGASELASDLMSADAPAEQSILPKPTEQFEKVKPNPAPQPATPQPKRGAQKLGTTKTDVYQAANSVASQPRETRPLRDLRPLALAGIAIIGLLLVGVVGVLVSPTLIASLAASPTPKPTDQPTPISAAQVATFLPTPTPMATATLTATFTQTATSSLMPTATFTPITPPAIVTPTPADAIFVAPITEFTITESLMDHLLEMPTNLYPNAGTFSRAPFASGVGRFHIRGGGPGSIWGRLLVEPGRIEISRICFSNTCANYAAWRSM